jgi:signal transduction histidine kinase
MREMMNLLLVECGAHLSLAQRRAMQQSGMLVGHAHSLPEARRALRETPVQVVALVTRAATPVRQLTRHMAALNSTARLLVLVARPNVRDAVQAMRQGAEDYVSLRVSPETLIAAIHALGCHGAHAAPAQVTPKEQDDLLSLVSHELRTPLMAINGYLELLQRHHATLPPEKAQEFIRRSLKATGELASLSDMLVRVARGDVAERVTTPAPLVSLAREAAESCETPDGARRVRVAIPSNLTLLAESGTTLIVLRNLISNALKYSPDGGDVLVAAHAISGDQVEIRVEDHGIGIAPEHLETIFQQFRRVPNTHLPEILGVGLGLYLCRQLVAAQGGRIWVESVAGQGSTFFVQLAGGAVPDMAVSPDALPAALFAQR